MAFDGILLLILPRIILTDQAAKSVLSCNYTQYRPILTIGLEPSIYNQSKVVPLEEFIPRWGKFRHFGEMIGNFWEFGEIELIFNGKKL